MSSKINPTLEDETEYESEYVSRRRAESWSFIAAGLAIFLICCGVGACNSISGYNKSQCLTPIPAALK